MKKVIALILSLILCVSLVACGKKTPDSQGSEPAATKTLVVGT